MSSWIAFHRSLEAADLQSRKTDAFLLLCQVARQLRWKPCPVTGLEIGQALVGDWKQAGIETEGKYRHAKKVLTRGGFATFKGTTKGTVATLTSSTIFSIYESNRNDPNNGQGADEQRTRCEPATTNLQGYKDTPKTQIEENPIDFQSIVGAYPRRENVQEALGYVSDSVKRGADPAAILTGTRAIAAVIGQLPSAHLNAFVVSAKTFFKNERWRDDPQTWLRHGASKNGAAASSVNIGGRKFNSVTRIVNGKPVTTKT